MDWRCQLTVETVVIIKWLSLKLLSRFLEFFVILSITILLKKQKIMTERISYQEVSKGFADGLMKTEYYLKNSGLDQKLIELMKYRVSQINGCAYCLDMHHKEAVHLGEDELRIHSLAAWKDCPFYNEKERAVLAYAEALTLPDNQESYKETFDKLIAYFSKSEIADLTLAITQINTWNRINKAFGAIPGNYKVAQAN